MFKLKVIVSLLYMINASAICQNWQIDQKLGNHGRELSEASGLTQSSINPDRYLWSNDSGNSAKIYITNQNGRIENSVRISGFSNIDYESLEIGPCFDNNELSCVYLGDVGDGIGWRSNFKIGIFREKDVLTKNTVTPLKVINYRYPNGQENSEAILPLSKNRLIIFSKSGSGKFTTYEMNLQSGDQTVKRLASFNLNPIMAGARGKGPRITDTSLSIDKKSLLLLTYNEIIELDAAQIFGQTPSSQWVKEVDYHLIQTPKRGLEQKETITYEKSGTFIVSSESPEGPGAIYRYRCQ